MTGPRIPDTPDLASALRDSLAAHRLRRIPDVQLSALAAPYVEHDDGCCNGLDPACPGYLADRFAYDSIRVAFGAGVAAGRAEERDRIRNDGRVFLQPLHHSSPEWGGGYYVVPADLLDGGE